MFVCGYVVYLCGGGVVYKLGVMTLISEAIVSKGE